MIGSARQKLAYSETMMAVVNGSAGLSVIGFPIFSGAAG